MWPREGTEERRSNQELDCRGASPRPAQPEWCREDKAMTRVPVPPKMLRWACERAGYDVVHFAERMPQLQAWVRREKQPTMKQLEKLAKVTNTPLGYLFLPEPPDERLPVPDYRTLAGSARGQAEPQLARHALHDATSTGVDAGVPRRERRGTISLRGKRPSCR